MNTVDTTLGWQRHAALGLALLSVVLPAIAMVLVPEPAAPATNPADLGDYRLPVAALILGLVCSIGGLIGSRRASMTAFRWLGVVLAIGGLLFSLYLLVALIGTCGVQVLWSTCRA